MCRYNTTMMFATSLLVFAVLNNNTFYTYQPPNVSHAFACFSKANESWPLQWTKLQSKMRNGVAVLEVSKDNLTDKLSLEYKLLYFYRNRSATATPWKIAYNDDASISACKAAYVPIMKRGNDSDDNAACSTKMPIDCNLQSSAFVDFILCFILSFLIIHKILIMYKLFILINKYYNK